MRNLLAVADLKAAEIDRIFAITEDLKTKYNQGLREALLPGRVMALLFEKPSLRTRVSFDAGMINLGGSSLFLGDDVGFGSRESVADFGRVLSQYADVIVVRAFKHQTAVDLARYSTCAVINALTDLAHPDPVAAVGSATAIYTDVWTSMGQEKQAEKRRKAFAAYQINAEMLAKAPAGALFMHCLPAHRGEEVTDEVIDGPQSIVVQQASNRLHVQKGILAWML